MIENQIALGKSCPDHASWCSFLDKWKYRVDDLRDRRGQPPLDIERFKDLHLELTLAKFCLIEELLGVQSKYLDEIVRMRRDEARKRVDPLDARHEWLYWCEHVSTAQNDIEDMRRQVGLPPMVVKVSEE